MVPPATISTLRLLPIVDALLSATDDEAMAEVLLRPLLGLIPADGVVWIERERGRPIRVRSHPAGVATPARVVAFERLAAHDPLAQRIREPGSPALRRSDVQSDREFRGLDSYAEVFAPIHSQRQLAFAVDTGSDRTACVSFHRSGTDFTAADLAYAELVRPRIAAARARLEPAAHPQWITEREAAVLDLLAEGLTNRQIGHRLGISPRTVGKHLEHSYAKLNERCRVGAATRWRAVAVRR